LPAAFNEQLIPKLGETQRKLKELQKEQEKAQQLLLDQVAKLQEEKEAILAKAQESEVTRSL
jgi:type I restriction enzyme R subunit